MPYSTLKNSELKIFNRIFTLRPLKGDLIFRNLKVTLGGFRGKDKREPSYYAEI